MGVFKRTKHRSSDSQSSSSSAGSNSSSNCSLEKKESAAHRQILKSSLHSSENSSAYKTCHSGSYGTCKSRFSAQKNVTFSLVHIREYERSLGDNPSCSSGAPIGIGWAFQNSLVLGVEEYERKHKRGRSQNEIILSRQEREQLLREWLTSDKEIAQSTRENLKVKFQRRRSVRNARKMEFFQNTIGKGIKKVLGIGGRKSDDCLLQAVPESGLMMQQSPDFEDAHEQFPEVSEPEEDDESDGDGHPSARASSRLLHKQSSSFDDMIDDATSAVSGITFGDSTTTSAYEMEMFHRELELEMFGAEPDELDESSVPRRPMLGQSLALPPEVVSESNSMSIVSGSHEEEMSSSSSTMHSFQSPNYSYYGSPGQMDISPVTSSTSMDYAARHEQQFPHQPPFYPQTHHRQYNPYARTSAYRGYSLRDAYRGNNKFSAFDMANQMQAPPVPPPYHVVEVTEPDDDEDDAIMMTSSRQSPFPLGAAPPPHIIPPMYPAAAAAAATTMDHTPVVPARYQSSDDNSGMGFSDVQSWEEFYYDLPADDGRYSRSTATDGYDSSTISMNLSNHSMSYGSSSYKSVASTHHEPQSAEVSVDSFSERSNLTARTQHC